MLRRLIRIVLASAAAGGAGFAIIKIVQSRRAVGGGMPSGDDSIMPKRSETPLVQPELLHGLDLRKSEQTSEAVADEHGNGQLLTEAPPVAPPGTDASGEGVAWVAPDASGTCPPTHPIKAKLASGIFHAPGMLAYDRTTPDRCYLDEASAEADGLRKAKR